MSAPTCFPIIRPLATRRITMRVVAACVCALVLGACAHHARVPPADTGDPMPTANADTQATGTVAVAGTAAASYATLRVEGAHPITLVGDLASELRRLSGATVRVTGRDAGAGPLGRRLDVQRYDILAIDGQTPFVGTLHIRDDTVWLVAADSVALAAVPDALRTQDGAKVWVTGRRTERGLEVQSYGVLRPTR